MLMIEVNERSIEKIKTATKRSNTKQKQDGNKMKTETRQKQPKLFEKCR